MSTKRFDGLYDCQRHGAAVRARCRRCGRIAYPDVSKLLGVFVMRGWDSGFPQAGERMRCSFCGARPCELRPWHAGAGMHLEPR